MKVLKEGGTGEREMQPRGARGDARDRWTPQDRMTWKGGRLDIIILSETAVWCLSDGEDRVLSGSWEKGYFFPKAQGHAAVSSMAHPCAHMANLSST